MGAIFSSLTLSSTSANSNQERKRGVSTLWSSLSLTKRTCHAMPPPKNMSLEALPAELLAQVLKRLDPESLSTCNGLNKLFHSQPSIVEQALRQVAIDEGFDVPETLPSACADWTQALLFLAVRHKRCCSSRSSAGRAAGHSSPAAPVTVPSSTQVERSS